MKLILFNLEHDTQREKRDKERFALINLVLNELNIAYTIVDRKLEGLWKSKFLHKSDSVWRLLLIHWSKWGPSFNGELTGPTWGQGWHPSWWDHTGIMYYSTDKTFADFDRIDIKTGNKATLKLDSFQPPAVKFASYPLTREQQNQFNSELKTALNVLLEAEKKEDIGLWQQWTPAKKRNRWGQFDCLEFVALLKDTIELYSTQHEFERSIAETYKLMRNGSPAVFPEAKLLDVQRTLTNLKSVFPALSVIADAYTTPSPLPDVILLNREIAKRDLLRNLLMFEEDRALLNHNTVKNEIISPLGISSSIKDARESDLWVYLFPSQTESIGEHSKEQIEASLIRLPKLKEQVQSLMDCQTKYDLKLNADGLATRAELKKNLDQIIEFKSTGVTENEAFLFIETLHDLYNLINHLSLNNVVNNRPFGDNLELK